MEPAKIDWKSIDSVFVEEALYENINAPKWVDFSAPDEVVDDEAWFCRSDCKHPKTVEDFFESTPNSSKRPGLSKVCEIVPLGDRNKREANIKRRGLAQSSLKSNIDSKNLNEDNENQNPNCPTTPIPKTNAMKSMMKSSSEKKKPIDDSTIPVHNDRPPKLRSTLSARNLFGGRDIMNQITGFCHELKKMATRAKDKENVEKEQMGDLNRSNKERKPLLEVGKEKSEASERSNGNKKVIRKKRTDESENIVPRPMELKIVKRKDEESLLQIRTNPPSPQCFSAIQGSTKPAIAKASKSRLMEKENHQEVANNNNNKELRLIDKSNNGRNSPAFAEKEAKSMDMFWFLKPCTISS